MNSSVDPEKESAVLGREGSAAVEAVNQGIAPLHGKRGRPRKNASDGCLKQSLDIRIAPSLKRQIRACASATSRSPSEVLDTALVLYLADLKSRGTDVLAEQILSDMARITALSLTAQHTFSKARNCLMAGVRGSVSAETKFDWLLRLSELKSRLRAVRRQLALHLDAWHRIHKRTLAQPCKTRGSETIRCTVDRHLVSELNEEALDSWRSRNGVITAALTRYFWGKKDRPKYREGDFIYGDMSRVMAIVIAVENELQSFEISWSEARLMVGWSLEKRHPLLSFSAIATGLKGACRHLADCLDTWHEAHEMGRSSNTKKGKDANA